MFTDHFNQAFLMLISIFFKNKCRCKIFTPSICKHTCVCFVIFVVLSNCLLLLKICKALIGTCIICIYINIIMITEHFCRKYSIQHVQSEFFFFGLRKGKKYIYKSISHSQYLDDLHKNISQISFKIYSFLV